MNDQHNYYKNLKLLGIPLWLDAQQSKKYLELETPQNKPENNATSNSTASFAKQELNALVDKLSLRTVDNATQENIKKTTQSINNAHITHKNNSVEIFSIKLKLIHYTQAQILLLFESSSNASINQIELLKLADNLMSKLNFNTERQEINFNWPFNKKFLASENEFNTTFSTFSKQLIEKNSINCLIVFGQKIKNQLQAINLNENLTILDDLPDFEALLSQKQLRMGVWNKVSVLQKS